MGRCAPCRHLLDAPFDESESNAHYLYSNGNEEEEEDDEDDDDDAGGNAGQGDATAADDEDDMQFLGARGEGVVVGVGGVARASALPRLATTQTRSRGANSDDARRLPRCDVSRPRSS